VTLPSLPDALLGLGLGLGLSAACGFRVFVPLLAISLGALTGHLSLAPGFSWVGSVPALLAFATATGLEIAAYYIPWFDHMLDVVATPTAVAAGILASASVMTDLPPLLRWTVALIGGGGAAGLIQGATVLLRLKSLAVTGGAANALVSTVELVGATGTVLLALIVPLVCLVAVAWFCIWAFRRAGVVAFGRRGAEAKAPTSPASE
jgi:uncharacterized protein DUF4126